MGRDSFVKNSNRQNVLEYLNRYKSNKTIDEASVPNVGPNLALELFGKIYGGDPNTGVVPGARGMSEEERIELTYKIAKDVLKQNGHDPSIADEWFLKWYGKSFN